MTSFSQNYKLQKLRLKLKIIHYITNQAHRLGYKHLHITKPKIKRGERITKNNLKENGKYLAISGGENPFGKIDN